MLVVLGLLLLAAPTAPYPRPALIKVLNGLDSPAWRRVGPFEFYAGEAIYEYMNGAGELPRACGFRDLAVARYADSGGAEVTIELYAMPSPGDAFGLTSLRAGPPRQGVDLTHRAWLGDGELHGWRGAAAYTIAAADPDAVSAEVLLALGRALEAGLPAAGEPPALAAGLPRQGQVEGTLRYFHGKFALDTVWFVADDLFDLAHGADVATAQYAAPDGLLLVASYPTPARAAAVVRRWSEASGLTAANGVLVGQAEGQAVAVTRREAQVRVARAATSETALALLRR